MNNEFFTKNDKAKKSDNNELLLDLIMEEHKKREKKHNITKGYMLKKHDSKPAVSVFNKKSETPAENNRTVQPLNSKEPIYVVNNSSKTYTSKKQKKVKSKNLKKFSLIMLCSFVFVAVVVGIVFAIMLNIKTGVTITCGNFNGISIVNEKNNEITEISLKPNEKFTFKVTPKPGYSNSEIVVTFNGTVIKPDDKGCYTIKHTNGKMELHIAGVRMDVYENDIRVVNDVSLRFNINSTPYSYLKSNYTFGQVVKFSLTYTNGELFQQNRYCVYLGNTLIEPKEVNLTSVNYEVTINKQANIEIYANSPFEFFKFEKKVDVNQVESYKITGLTELGKQQTTIALPNEYLGVNAELAFDKSETYEKPTQIVLNKISKNFDYSGLDQFVNAENFFVCNKNDNGLPNLSSQSGVLYMQNRIMIKNCLKVPKSYAKNLTSKALSLSGNILKTGACNGLKYVKQITLNFNEIEPLAFNETRNYNEYSLVSANSNYVVRNGKELYKVKNTDELILHTVLYSGMEEFYMHEDSCTEIGSYAFANTLITTVRFAPVGKTLNPYCFANMPNLSGIEITQEIENIPNFAFYGCTNLKVVVLNHSLTAKQLPVNTFALIGNISRLAIVVPDNLFLAYKQLNPTFESNFLKASDYY